MAETNVNTQAAAEDAVSQMFDEASPDPIEEVAEPEVEEETTEDVVAETAEGDEREVKPEVEGDESVEVEFEGKLYEVPVELKDALLRTADYTTKTQEVAQQRKAVEVMTGQVELERSQYEFAQSVWDELVQAQNIEADIGRYQDHLRNNIDTLSSTDIEKIRFQMDELRQSRDKLVQEVQGKQTAHQQAQEQTRAELLKQGTEVLKQAIPDWGPEKQKQVQEFAIGLGYAPNQLETASPVDIQVLHKAMQFDALVANKGAAVTKVQAAPKIKPSSRNPMPKAKQEQLNLRKKLKSGKGTNQEKADLIGKSLERFF